MENETKIWRKTINAIVEFRSSKALKRVQKLIESKSDSDLNEIFLAILFQEYHYLNTVIEHEILPTCEEEALATYLINLLQTINETFTAHKELPLTKTAVQDILKNSARVTIFSSGITSRLTNEPYVEVDATKTFIDFLNIAEAKKTLTYPEIYSILLDSENYESLLKLLSNTKNFDLSSIKNHPHFSAFIMNAINKAPSYPFLKEKIINPLANDLTFLSTLKGIESLLAIEIIMHIIEASDTKEKETYFFQVLKERKCSNYNSVLLCALEMPNLSFTNHLASTLISDYDIDINYNPVRYVGPKPLYMDILESKSPEVIKAYLKKNPQVQDFYYGYDESVRVDLVSIYLKAGEYKKALETFASINLYQDIDVNSLESEGRFELPLFQMAYQDVLSTSISTLKFLDIENNTKKELINAFLADPRVKYIHINMLEDMSRIYSFTEMLNILDLLYKDFERGTIKFLAPKDIDGNHFIVVLTAEEVKQYIHKEKEYLRTRNKQN